jgi:threonine/homoserine/homoserine lactone efflux protein
VARAILRGAIGEGGPWGGKCHPRCRSMWTYLGLGLSMGLSAGMSPGPLLALVVTASLRSGLKGGLWVAMSPFITDAPIVALSVFLIDRLPPQALRWVGTIGGLVVIWLGIEIFRSARKAQLGVDGFGAGEPRRELWRGAAVNILSPHPYLFWATVGAPALVGGWRISAWHALAFLASFYALLVGSKMGVAWLVSRQAGALSSAWYRRILLGCGLLLLGLGGFLIWRSWAGY